MEKGDRRMKCVNCEKAEAAAGWDSLAFERRKEWQSVYEWATGYEKAGLCPACRADLAKENEAMLFPKQHRGLWIAANVLGGVGAVLAVLDFFYGSRNVTIVGVALLLASVLLGYMKWKDDSEGPLLGVSVFLFAVGAYGIVRTLFFADWRETVDVLGWISLALLVLAALVYWLGGTALKAHAAKAESPLDALLLGKAQPEGHRYVPLGEGLYRNKKAFLEVNSLLDKNEAQVYDEFIATGKWKELVENPQQFRFLGM